MRNGRTVVVAEDDTGEPIAAWQSVLLMHVPDDAESKADWWIIGKALALPAAEASDCDVFFLEEGKRGD